MHVIGVCKNSVAEVVLLGVRQHSTCQWEGDVYSFPPVIAEEPIVGPDIYRNKLIQVLTLPTPP